MPPRRAGVKYHVRWTPVRMPAHSAGGGSAWLGRRTSRTIAWSIRGCTVRLRARQAATCPGVIIMRGLFSGVVLLALGGCALFEPSGQRYIVFFTGSSAQLDAAAQGVVVGA